MTDQPWRVGTHYSVHVYEGQRPIATFFTSADARLAVQAYNEFREKAEGGPDEALSDLEIIQRHALDTIVRLTKERDEARATIARAGWGMSGV